LDFKLVFITISPKTHAFRIKGVMAFFQSPLLENDSGRKHQYTSCKMASISEVADLDLGLRISLSHIFEIVLLLFFWLSTMKVMGLFFMAVSLMI